MGTRATYHFDASDYRPAATVYIHWDGYLEGAAAYFHAMLETMVKLDDGPVPRHASAGGYFEAFIRGNLSAELTADHETHGDTEFRYDLDRAGNLTARARGRWDSDEWKVEYFGPVHEFVNHYGAQQVEGIGDDPWRVVKLPDGPVVLGRAASIRAEIQRRIMTLGQWSRGGHATGYNADHMRAEIMALEMGLARKAEAA